MPGIVTVRRRSNGVWAVLVDGEVLSTHADSRAARIAARQIQIAEGADRG